MEMMLANERRAPRRSVLVECQVVRESDFALLGERGVDLSTCGMLLLCDIEAGVGEDVFVSLRVPGTDRWIDTRGHIARIVADKPGLGIAFDGFDPETARTLHEALRVFPPPVPARAPRVDYAATAAMVSLT
ncbi:PilZ domain-containing protein [Polyangium aurulentum]|uniref:PilZ domain-containing protein n=1 Tax=Polyangium aurulentum TaxID=2567896 RepID=UPI0010AE6AF6|nr:PilZ domain-containing protein [Polyangium aurulentum]UQA59302.1 PilZ domain-containing protein [Polyangium aurulentum]